MKVSLEPELTDIRYKVNKLIDEIDSDVISRNVFHGGIGVEAKGKKVPELLKKECLNLINDYHSIDDTEKIELFIKNECNRITATFKKHSFPHERYIEFDRRIDDLIKLVRNRAYLLRKKQPKVPKWLPALIITVVGGLLVVVLSPIILSWIGYLRSLL